MTDTWPGTEEPIDDPFRPRPARPSSARIAGNSTLWLARTVKFFSPSFCRFQDRRGGRGRGGLKADGRQHVPAARVRRRPFHRIQRAVDDLHLRPARRASSSEPACPGTLSMSP